MDRQITEQIVDNALLNDKEGFMSAFQAAMATKVADALEIKKVEVASNMLGAVDVAQEDTLEEEVEQVDEGLVKTIKRGMAGWGAGGFDKDKPKDVINRVKGQDTYVLKKLSDPAARKGKGSPAELQQKVISRELKKRGQGVTEEVEQIDELKASTLGSYIKKAQTDAVDRSFNLAIDGDRIVNPDRKTKKAFKRDVHVLGNRMSGIDRAVDRLTKEEAEQVDEAAKGPLHVVHVSFTNLAAVGPHRSTMNYKVHAPDKEAAKRYAERDLRHKSRSGLKAHSARLVK